MGYETPIEEPVRYGCCHGLLRNPLHCIVPPHIVQEIIRRGDEKVRTSALKTLGVDSSLRQARAGTTAFKRTVRRQVNSRRLGFQDLRTALDGCNGEVERTIYSADNKQKLPGRVVRHEGDPFTDDPSIDEAYDGIGDTYDLFCKVYGRDSLDDNGMPLDATVHFGEDYDNALWDGQRMIFGDGDGIIFNRFTIAVDVIAHELTHGVTEFETGLIYWGQPGALNESISDVFGSLVKQYNLGQTADEADWLVGEGLFTDQVQGDALRSMKAPGTAYDDPVLGNDPQPGHTRDYVRTFEDNGGVHINSGIPNKAFYLAATKIGGEAWKKAGLIWYQTLQSPLLRPTIRFRGFAFLTIQTARAIFGPGSDEHNAVIESWDEVGVRVPVARRQRKAA